MVGPIAATSSAALADVTDETGTRTGPLNSPGHGGRRAGSELGQQPLGHHGDRLTDLRREAGPGGETTAFDAVADQPVRKPAQSPGQLDGVRDPERVGAVRA